MSSPKAAVAKPARAPKPATRAAAKPLRAAAKPAPAARPAPQAATALSEEAARLAAAIERELAEGRADMLTTEAFHALMGALCRTYAAQIEAGGEDAAARRARQRRQYRRDDHGERAVALRQSRRVRARHVAELDRPVNVHMNPQAIA